jgi:hypothetical protein
LFTFPGIELTSIYNLDDPVEFVEKWMAFSISNLSGAEPTVAFLNDFENKELKNQNKATSKQKRVDESKRSQLKVYNQESEDEENDILGAYVCITPKVSQHSIFPRVNFLLQKQKEFRKKRSPSRSELDLIVRRDEMSQM